MLIGRFSKLKLTLAVSALIVLGAGFTWNQEAVPALYIPRLGGTTPDVTYSWEVPAEALAKVPKEMPVYKFVTKNLTDQDFKSLASQFGMTDKIERDQNQSFLMKSGEKRLSLNWETGKWSYGDYSKLYRSENSDAVPSDDEVARIATGYLKEKGWLPADFRLQSVEVLTEQSAANITAPAKVIGKVAYFYRYLGEQPVLGVSRIIVHVGNNGEIVGVKKFFKDIQPVGNMALKTVDEAFAEVKAGSAVLTTDNPNVKQAAVDNVEVAYWEDAGSISDQSHLQPVYLFKAKATNGATDTFTVVVPALKGVTLKPSTATEVPSTGPKVKP